MFEAIDRFDLGVEKEVSAASFDNQGYIPRRERRFWCPECGELVILRQSSLRSSCFAHKEKTDRSPECDRRVDGRSGLSLRQRVGLPVYLQRKSQGLYRLAIGFPALGSKLLKEASDANCKVRISSYDKDITIPINQTNFYEEETTQIAVNFIPPSYKKYSIAIKGEKNIERISRKWSDYADGFASYGAFFTCNDNGGRKIRKNDGITTQRYYYVVTDKDLSKDFHKEFIERDIFYEYAGKLEIKNNSTYNVFKIRINIYKYADPRFRYLDNLLFWDFGLKLLDPPPEIIPVWPPVVAQNDYYIPVSNEKEVVCSISSGNENPNVFSYSGSNTRKIGTELFSKTRICRLNLDSPQTLSVDRKYVGREVTFLSKTIRSRDYSYQLTLKNKEDEIPWKEVDGNSLSQGCVLSSNSRMETYVGTQDKIFRHIRIRDNETEIPAERNLAELYFITRDGGLIRHLSFEPAHSNIQNNAAFNNQDFDKSFANQIYATRHGRMVPTPRWVDFVIRTLKNNYQESAYAAVMSAISNGKIYVNTLEKLRAIELINSKFNH